MIIDESALWLLAAAFLVDAVVGDPDWLWRRTPHPVVLFGRLIGWLDRVLNRPARSSDRRRVAGVAGLLILSGLAVAIGLALTAGLRALPGGYVGEILLIAVFLAQRALHEHVRAVALGLASGGLAGGRAAVARIVGRDPDSLDQAGVCRAAIESNAENWSDGVLAPAFWYALFGLPGLLLYKAANTADSMIGHRTPRHGAFGWAAARFDDGLNLVPARLSGLIIALAAPAAGGRIDRALRTMLRDAPKHRSPNAGWPEAAMAGALGLALAGPRRYRGTIVPDAWMGNGRAEAKPADIRRSLRITATAGLIALAITVAVAFAFLSR
jgi:adenosylcobinamide-phosphate synthase